MGRALTYSLRGYWSLMLVKKLPALQDAYGTVTTICKPRLFSNWIKFIYLFLVILRFRSLEKKGCYEFKVRLGNTASSRIAGATE